MEASLGVTNQDPPIPAAQQGRLFESMVSGRMGDGGDTPHLGLFVVRIFARFQGGELHAENLAGAVRSCAMLRVVS